MLKREIVALCLGLLVTWARDKRGLKRCDSDADIVSGDYGRGQRDFTISSSNSLQKSSAIQKISVTLLLVIMICNCFIYTIKLLKIKEFTKQIGDWNSHRFPFFYLFLKRLLSRTRVCGNLGWFVGGKNLCNKIFVWFVDFVVLKPIHKLAQIFTNYFVG